MLTKPISTSRAPTETSALSLLSRCKIFTQGVELDLTMVAALYAIIQLARKKQEQTVFGEDGTLLLRHDGQKALESAPGFEEAIVSFSDFLLEEQRLGYALYEAAVKQQAEGPAGPTASA